MIRFLQQNNNIHYIWNLPFFTSSKLAHGKTRWRRSADQILVVKVKATLELPSLKYIQTLQWGDGRLWCRTPWRRTRTTCSRGSSGTGPSWRIPTSSGATRWYSTTGKVSASLLLQVGAKRSFSTTGNVPTGSFLYKFMFCAWVYSSWWFNKEYYLF